MRARNTLFLFRRHFVTSLGGHNLLHLPNSSEFACLLRFFIDTEQLQGVRGTHGCLLKSHFATEVFIQNRLIDAYSKCGSIENAVKLFEKMSSRNTFTWNAVIAAQTRAGLIHDAVDTFVRLPERDQCSWNSMVSGFAQHGWYEDALEYLAGMHREGFTLGPHALSSALSACACLLDLRMGAQIHAASWKSSATSDVFVGSALVDMYSKCGRPIDACTVFDRMTERNVVSWNSLITCYEQNGSAKEALILFERMIESDKMVPDEVTLASVVSACASLPAVELGMQIHAKTVRSDRLRDDVILNNALVDFYSKCNRIKKARHVFDSMPVRSVVSGTSIVNGYAKSAADVPSAWCLFTQMEEKNIVAWNALISGYTQNDESEEAVRLFRRLKREPLWPSHYTLGNILCACAKLADFQLGQQMHVHVLKHVFNSVKARISDSDVYVGNSLIDMYLKCGSIADGTKTFEKMPVKDRVSWNTMIVGYAHNGHGKEAISLFRRMLRSGETPDDVTMIGVLSSCSHAGLVEEGREYFWSMTEDHGLAPSRDHYTCMVDLLGRAGHFDEVEEFVKKMPIEPDGVLWCSLLAACRVHRNFELGHLVANRLLNFNSEKSSPYVLLANMYVENAQWSNAGSLRKKMSHRRIVKQVGCSWVKLERDLHVFKVGDMSHHKTKDIYEVSKSLLVNINEAFLEMPVQL